MEKVKVLVVDDEALMRKLVRDFLVKKDYEVVEAEDGEQLRQVLPALRVLQPELLQEKGLP